MENADIAIVGGGIIGLATAYQLSEQHPDRRLVILEKEAELAAHQSGRNSGVLHSGVYYRPGSLKARNCRLGKEAMERFCAAEGVPYDICGKVIVAVTTSEIGRLENIFDRGQQNGVKCEMIEAQRLHELEPYAKGVKALHVPEAGIVDYRRVCQRMGEIVTERGAQICYSTRVRGLRQSDRTVVIETTAALMSTSTCTAR